MISIIGAGLGNVSLLSKNSLEKIKNAELLITTDRLFAQLGALNKSSVCLPLTQIAGKIKENDRSKKIVVLASGDIGFYSISTLLKSSLKDEFELEFISGVSSLQYFTAKLQIDYEKIKTVSLHGREKSPIPFVCYNERVFFLTGGKYKAHDVINELSSCGLGGVKVTVGENLSSENERILSDTADRLIGLEFDNLSVMLVENREYKKSQATLHDADFLRGNVPMTKEAVRNLSLCSLEILPDDIVYDIGAGTGSVAVAMAYKACEGRVYAIEKNESAVELIRMNKAKTGAFNIVEINETAPKGLENLPPPDKVFIGGSGGNLKDIFDVISDKNHNVKITVNAITLETLQEAKICFEERGITPEITCINVAVSEKKGNYSMMKGQNPVYIICGKLQ